MRTLQEHLDDLDRMVEGGTSVAKMRSQIAFIGREVAALEADYARLTEAHSQADGIHRKAIAHVREQHSKVVTRLRQQIKGLNSKIAIYDADSADGCSTIET